MKSHLFIRFQKGTIKMHTNTKIKMILDKTVHFVQIRHTPIRDAACLFSLESIRSNLKSLSSEIIWYNNKLERNNLPSFNLKDRRTKDILNLKSSIEDRIRDLNVAIKNFIVPDSIITDKINLYFTILVKKCTIEYKNYEQKNVLMSDLPSPDIHHDPEEYLKQDTIYKNSQIKSSIINLTNSLIQLKMILKSQISMIDTIDFYFDKSNVYLEEANKEIDKIPKRYTRFKDWVIYTLLYVISILFMMILIKVYKKQHWD